MQLYRGARRLPGLALGRISHAVNVGAPDVLVQLGLETGWDVVGEHPFGKRLHVHFPPYRREEQRPSFKVPLLDDRARPFIVGAVRNDELDLAIRAEVLEVRPAVLFDLTRAGAFHVEDDLRPRIDRSDVDRAGCLDQHFETVVRQTTDQVERLALRQRLAAGDLDQVAAVALHVRDHVIDRHLLAAGEGVLRVAPAATKVATGQPDEDTGPPGMGRLPLDAEEDFRNPHRLPGVYRSERQSLRWTAVCATFFGEEIELSDAAGNPSPLPSPGGRGRSSGVTCPCKFFVD